MTRTFDNITPELVNKVRAKLSDFGITLSGDSGNISHMGVKANYAYDPAALTLTLSNVEVGMPASFAGYSPEKIFKTVEEAIAKHSA
jgi:hypothetical protein